MRTGAFAHAYYSGVEWSGVEWKWSGVAWSGLVWFPRPLLRLLTNIILLRPVAVLAFFARRAACVWQRPAQPATAREKHLDVVVGVRSFARSHHLQHRLARVAGAALEALAQSRAPIAHPPAGALCDHGVLVRVRRGVRQPGACYGAPAAPLEQRIVAPHAMIAPAVRERRRRVALQERLAPSRGRIRERDLKHAIGLCVVVLLHRCVSCLLYTSPSPRDRG